VAARRDCIFVVDLFARDGSRPDSLEDAFARKSDLLFSNQTLERLEAGQNSERSGASSISASAAAEPSASVGRRGAHRQEMGLAAIGRAPGKGGAMTAKRTGVRHLKEENRRVN
jgi:hypothetical protein